MRLHSVVVLAPLLLLSLAHSVGVGAKFVSPTRHGVVSDVSSTIIIVEDAKGKMSSERKRRGENESVGGRCNSVNVLAKKTLFVRIFRNLHNLRSKNTRKINVPSPKTSLCPQVQKQQQFLRDYLREG